MARAAGADMTEADSKWFAGAYNEINTAINVREKNNFTKLNSKVNSGFLHLACRDTGIYT